MRPAPRPQCKSRTPRLWGALCLFAGLVAGQAGFAACALDRVEIKGARSTSAFTIELADDAGERAIGLMNRESMPKFSGMLFVYDTPGAPAFWMKNTLIPLDMLFITPRGRIQHIEANTVPHDETPRRGGGGVLAVLEINGGLSEQLGIKPGDVLRHPAFSAFDPLWPCDP